MDAGRIGLLSDSHSRSRDGSDLPDSVLRAFDGVDLIFHLGDMGQVASLDRLAEVAPVVATKGMHAVGRDPRIVSGVRVLKTPTHVVGGLFDLTSAVPGLFEEGALDFDPEQNGKDLDALFGQRVRVVAFAMTHFPVVEERVLADGSELLFVNPGSPTLPADGPPTVAILNLRETRPSVEIREL